MFFGQLALRIWNRLVANGPFGNHPTLANGLVSYWKLDEQSGARYDAVTASANDLTDNNTVTYQNQGPVGTVAQFSAAASERLTCGPIGAAGDLSVSFWYKPAQTAPAGDLDLLTRLNSGTFLNDYQVVQGAFTENVYIRLYDSVAGSVNAHVTMPDLGWHFFTVTYDSSAKTATIRMDDSASATTAALTNGLRTTGNQTRFAPDGLEGRAGAWTAQISSAVITSLYNTGKAKPYSKLSATEKTGLVSYWNLDETSDGSGPVTRVDSAGSNNLTDNNTVTSVVNATMPHNVGGFFTRANAEYLSHVDNSSLRVGTNDFTFACWIDVGTYAATEGIIDKGSQADYTLDANGGNLRFYVKNGGAYPTAQVAEPATGTWNLVIAWRSAAGGNVNIQLNNGAVSSTAAAIQNNDTAGAFTIGSIGSGSNFDGQIDEVGFWTRALTTQERSDLWASGAGLFYDS